MSKPVSRKDAFLRKVFADPPVDPAAKDPDREKRRLKREAKKARTKHFRTLAKRDIHSQEADDEQ